MKFKIDRPREFLKQARINSGYSLRDVSKHISFSSSYISRMENGSSSLSLELLVELCNFYCINVYDIVEEDSISKVVQDNKTSIDLEKLVLSDLSLYKEKKIRFSDRVRIVQFIDFITSTDNMELKANCMDMINSIKKIANNLEKEEDDINE